MRAQFWFHSNVPKTHWASTAIFPGEAWCIKAQSQDKIEELKYELASIIRPVRGLRPKDADNFSTIRLHFSPASLTKVFGWLTSQGLPLGHLPCWSGHFGCLPISCLSLSRSTSIIGIKNGDWHKALFYFAEYLLEAIILMHCRWPSGTGFGMAAIDDSDQFLHFDMFISYRNMLLGLVCLWLSACWQDFPALSASRMDPVEAIRK